jgi:hypothetical protein
MTSSIREVGDTHHLRALEHHVLVDMGEPGDARLLVDRAHLEVDVADDARDAGFGDHQDLHAVAEDVLLHVHVDRAVDGEGRECQESQQSQ